VGNSIYNNCFRVETRPAKEQVCGAGVMIPIVDKLELLEYKLND
jgi:hypothetical protein